MATRISRIRKAQVAKKQQRLTQQVGTAGGAGNVGIVFTIDV